MKRQDVFTDGRKFSPFYCFASLVKVICLISHVKERQETQTRRPAFPGESFKSFKKPNTYDQATSNKHNMAEQEDE